jgi:hypothetical protein
LEAACKERVAKALKKLNDLQMLDFSLKTREIVSLQLGKIISYCYVSHTIVYVLRKLIKEKADYTDICAVLSTVEDFKGINDRGDVNEVLRVLTASAPIQIKSFGVPKSSGRERAQIKRNVLFQVSGSIYL